MHDCLLVKVFDTKGGVNVVFLHGEFAMGSCQRLGFFQGSDKIAVIVVVNDVYTSVPLKTLGGSVEISSVHACKCHE